LPIFTQTAKLGIEVPKSLEAWADYYFPRYTVLPWLEGSDHQRVQTMRDYLGIAFDRRADCHDWTRSIREGDSTSHRPPGAGANNFRFLELSSRAVDQSPVRKHCETAKAECGCEEIAAGNSTQLHLIAPGAMSSRKATAGDGVTA
jgi:hypothetical protein